MKATKLRKLVTKATELETHMQRHSVEACDSGYDNLPLHVAFEGRRQWWRLKLSVKKELEAKNGLINGCSRLFFSEKRLLLRVDGGFDGGGANNGLAWQFLASLAFGRTYWEEREQYRFDKAASSTIYQQGSDQMRAENEGKCYMQRMEMDI